MIKSIGWIGTGILGLPMCQHLMEKTSHRFHIFNRTKSKAQPLIDKGAKYANIVDFAPSCDVIFLMVGYPHDVENIVFGPSGLLSLMKPNSYIVDHTTNSPELAKKIFEEAKSRGIHAVDAPVTGGDVGARKGTLVIMAGGEEADFEEISPLMKCYGSDVKLMGSAECGQSTKVANQIMISTCVIGVCEGLIYGKKAGLDLKDLIDLLKSGGASCFMLNSHGSRILEPDFDPGFYVEHFVKDLGIALHEAKKMKLSLPGLALAEQLYLSLMANGGGRKSLLFTFEQLSNVHISE